MNDTSFLISLSGHKIYHRSSGIERAGGKKDRDDRIILGPNVELLHSHNTPTLDEVLETIRGKKKQTCNTHTYMYLALSFEGANFCCFTINYV